MKQSILVTLFCFALCSIAKAQLEPQFMATIWVEDAIGNKDSIEIGYDTSATEWIDFQFGEIALTNPFDSVLDIRGVDVSNFWSGRAFSKRIIGWPEKMWPSGCYIGNDVVFVVWAKYQPITISWDRTVFAKSDCNSGSIISNHFSDVTSDPFFWNNHPLEENHCMASENNFTAYTNEDSIKFYRQQWVEEEVKGLGLQKIYAFRQFTRPYFSDTPCVISNTQNVPRNNQQSSVYLYPNPVQNRLIIEAKGIIPNQIQIYDISGKMISQHKYSDSVNLMKLMPSVYIIKLIGEDGRYVAAKFVKI